MRAQIVEHPNEYRWSSYRFNALGRHDEVITPHPLYEQLGSDTSMRQSEYRGLFAGHIDAADLYSIRKGTQTGAVVGDDRFREEIRVMIDQRVVRFQHGGDRKSERFREGRGAH